MATRIDIDYERQFINSAVQEIIARAAASLNVLTQLGSAYQALPGLAMASYQADADALEADLETLHTLTNQMRSLLIAIDAKAGPLDEKNKKLLPTLRGLLQTAAEVNLLDQITGATPHPRVPPVI